MSGNIALNNWNYCIQMTDLPSIMDKIRILRSSRRKTNPGIVKEKAPSATVAPLTTSDVVFSKSPQQWVPFLVLDISQPKDDPAIDEKAKTRTSTKEETTSTAQTMPTLTAVPVTSSSVPPSTEVMTTSIPSKNDKTVIKTVTTKRSSPRKNKKIPYACTIMVTSKDLKGDKAKTQKNEDNSEEDAPVLMPASNAVAILDKAPPKEKLKAVKVSEPLRCPVTTADSAIATSELQKDVEPARSKDSDLTTTLAPVGCVICSKNFPTLTEMQAHYLSEHKNRRGREGRKRNVDVVNGETQKTPCPVPRVQVKEGSSDNAEAKLPLYVSDSDPKCPVCSIAFKDSSEVKNHVMLVHSYRCSECNDTFYTLFEFTSHKCNKGAKKCKKTKKKLLRSPDTNKEVAKAMNNFVPIQPKVKKKSKMPDKDEGGTTLLPLLPKVTESSVVPLSVSPSVVSTGNKGSELQINATSKLQITSANQSEVCLANNRTPSPKLTISPLENKQNSKNIRVLETKNLRCFKFKKDELVDETTTSKTNLIKEKLAQLKNNPNVSVSWVPQLRIKTDEDSDYVCGRCNVICDDMEDYMDHIHDCLTITSVTLERTSNPPQRILKLQKEVASFGFQETNNNRYSINKNLMQKLREVLPLTEEVLKLKSPPLKLDQTKTLLTSQCPDAPDLICQNHSLDQSHCPDASDLIYQNHPQNQSSKETNIREAEFNNSFFCIKEEPIDDFVQSEYSVVDHKEPAPLAREKLVCNTFHAGQLRTTTPMVMIPVEQACSNKFLAMSNKQPVRLPSPTSSSPSSPWDSSSVDLLIDTDDIKMEVEEEIIDDNF